MKIQAHIQTFHGTRYAVVPCGNCGSRNLSCSQENPYGSEFYVGCLGCSDYDNYIYHTGATVLDAVNEWNAAETERAEEERERKAKGVKREPFEPGEPPISFDERCAQVWAECRALDSGRNY